MVRNSPVALALFVFAATHSAWGFVPYLDEAQRPLRWNFQNSAAPASSFNPTTKAIRYYIGADGWSSTNRTAEINAVRASFGQWQSIPGTVLRFEEGGLIEGSPRLELDGTNTVFWAKDLVLPDGTTLVGKVGYTRLHIGANNEVIEADIVLNGVHQAWITDVTKTNDFRYFAEAVLAHEIGHFLGLDHTPVGSATVIRGAPGISTEAGLSVDEVAAARWLYPAAPPIAGTLTGTITLNGAPALGAIVTLEDDHGNVVGGTVSDHQGVYRMPAIAPGTYRARVSPLDPRTATAPHILLQGADIGPDHRNAVTEFLPTDNVDVALEGNQVTTQNWALEPGSPMRITGILTPAPVGSPQSTRPSAVQLPRGGAVMTIGVLGANLPTAGAILAVTGDGITLTPTAYRPNRFGDGRNALTVNITVAADAVPGMRSFMIWHEGKLAYANGYLEILPAMLDYDFDGFDDQYQRARWAPFTRAEADPGADPDGDRYSNLAEFMAGSNPLDPLSFFFRIQGLRRTGRGYAIDFESAPGKRYQPWAKSQTLNTPWQKIGQPLTAVGHSASFTDSVTGDRIRVYHIEALPE